MPRYSKAKRNKREAKTVSIYPEGNEHGVPVMVPWETVRRIERAMTILKEEIEATNNPALQLIPRETIYEFIASAIDDTLCRIELTRCSLRHIPPDVPNHPIHTIDAAIQARPKSDMLREIPIIPMDKSMYNRRDHMR